MNIQKNQAKPAEIEMIMEVSPLEYQPFLQKAATRISQASKIEGFRVGKAPYDVIKQRVGEMAIYQEALDDIVSHFYYQAVVQEKLDVVAQPKIDLEKMAPGNPIVFKAVSGLMPKVELGDYKNIKVKPAQVKVEDDKVEKIIEDIRRMQAKETAVDRECKMGDMAEIDFTVSLDKVVIDGGVGKKYPLVLGEGSMIPGFEEAIVGLKKDEEKIFQLKFPAEYQNKGVAGKLCDFKIKVLSVFERELPEVTDDWAKTLGATGAVDLRAKIRRNLEEEAKYSAEQKTEIEILTKIVGASKISEIPETLVDSEAHRMVHEFESSIAEQGIKFEEYLKSIKKEEKDLAEDFKPKAVERVKTSLVIKAIGDAEKIEVTPDELLAETEKILTQIKGNAEAEANIKGEGYQHYLQTILRNKKIIEMLKSICLS